MNNFYKDFFSYLIKYFYLPKKYQFFNLQSDAPEPVELEDMINDELTTDSELDVPHEADRLIPTVSDVSSLEKSYVVKRIKEQNGTVYYQPAAKSSGGHNRGFSDSIGEIL